MFISSITQFLKKINTKYYLLILLLFSLCIRANRIDIGFPGLFVSNDEAIFHQSALNMLANKTPFTLGNYGPLGAYTQLPFIVLAFFTMLLQHTVSGVKQIEFLLLTQEGYLLFIPRLISAMFGTLSILVIYKISMLFWNDKKAALWAAFFGAISFNLMLVSHLARAWSPSIFFSLTAAYFAIRSTKGHQGKYIVLSFIAAALGFGYHQISGIIILPVLLIHILHFKKTNSIYYIAGFLLWMLLILLLNFLSLKNNVFSALTPGNPTVGLIFLPQNPLNIFSWLSFFLGKSSKVLLDLMLTDGVIILLALFYFVQKRNITRSIFSIGLFILFNFIAVSTIFPPFVRYFLIGFAFLPIFAGAFFSKMLAYNPNKILVGILLILGSFNSVWWNYVISKPATFEMLEGWINDNVPQDTMILINQRRNFSYVPSKRSAEIIRKYVPGFYQRSSSVIGDSYPANVRDVIYIEAIDKSHQFENVEYMLKTQPVKYVIVSYLYKNGRLQLDNKDNIQLIKHFSPTGKIIYYDKIPEALFDAPYFMPLFQLERAGPYIDVFKVN